MEGSLTLAGTEHRAGVAFEWSLVGIMQAGCDPTLADG